MKQSIIYICAGLFCAGVFLFLLSKVKKEAEPTDYKKELCEGCEECNPFITK